MFWRTYKAAVHASYAIALHVAKTKKPHNIDETLLKPCILESVKLVLGEKASQTMKQISLSNDTIKSRIHEMSDNIKSKVCLRLTPLLFFLFSWMKAQIYPISHSYLSMSDMLQMKGLMRNFCYVRYVADERINEEPLETTSKAVDVFQMLIDFLTKPN